MSLPNFEILDVQETGVLAGFGCFGSCTNENNNEKEKKEDDEKK